MTALSKERLKSLRKLAEKRKHRFEHFQPQTVLELLDTIEARDGEIKKLKEERDYFKAETERFRGYGK